MANDVAVGLALVGTYHTPVLPFRPPLLDLLDANRCLLRLTDPANLRCASMPVLCPGVLDGFPIDPGLYGMGTRRAGDAAAGWILSPPALPIAHTAWYGRIERNPGWNVPARRLQLAGVP